MGWPVPDRLQTWLNRDWRRLLWQREPVREGEAERSRLFRESKDPALQQVRLLYQLLRYRQ